MEEAGANPKFGIEYAFEHQVMSYHVISIMHA
jgi:hypothetical protein